MSTIKKKKHGDELIAVQILQGFVFRRHRHRHRRLHHLPPVLAAVSGSLLLLIALILFLFPPISTHHTLHHLNTSLSNRVHIKIEKDRVFRVPMGGGSLGRTLWTWNQSDSSYGCSNASHNFLAADMNTEPNRYLLIATSGGLNQQRTGIVDAVVSAYILKSALVVPKLDQKSFWKDASNFSDIFDVDWFIRYLSRDVKIVEQLPIKSGKVVTTRAPRKCNQKCYETRILPIFRKKRVQAIRLTKFDYRLSNRLGPDLQKLRCRVNYHALRFTDPILEMGMKLVDRMRAKSKHYVALHLRFEPDMLAFSGCYYGGGNKEIKELGTIRKRWKTLHTKNPEKERRHGKCLLTPEEVGLMLRVLGFGKDVHIYVASGEVYGGEEIFAPLRALFPNIHTKETIASKDELVQFSPYSSRMAALDFIVCDESDVFVANNNGNMAKMLAGKRRYFGHKPTIRPNAKKLYQAFEERNKMTWEEFAFLVRKFQVGFMGEVRPGKGGFHEYPLSCICENMESRALRDSALLQNRAKNDADKSTDSNVNDEGLSEDEQDLSETEYYSEEVHMAIRKLLFLSKHVLLRHQLLTSQQVSGNWSRLLPVPPNGYLSRREFSMFNELSEKIKGEVERNQDFQKSIKEIKEKAEELKGVKEDLKVRTKQTTEQLYKQVDGVWNEAEAKAKRVYADVEEKISAAKEEVKGSFGIGNQEAAKQDSESSNNKDGSKFSFGEEKQGDAETLFSKFKFGIPSISPKVSLAFQKVKEAKPVDLVKKGYEIVKDELKGNPNRRKHLEYDAFTTAQPQNIERSTRTDIVVLPSTQSPWSKKWEAFKNKMRGHPVFKSVSGISEPVIGKSQEIAEDMRERWETSDHPVVHKIQDISETVLGESDVAMSFKEIRRRDPTFSLPEFVAEVQEVVQPVLNAYFKGDTEVLKKYCSSHVIERCKAEHKAYKSQGIFFDHKILHISEVEVRETKMMGETPIIIVAFQTQQVYCVRDKLGSVTEGGQDTIHTVFYAWAMQQLDPEEVGEGAPYSIWKLREIQQQGVQALI
ncbi:O-fucosyltransferase family protein [Striga asiatica]|uniref:O-fucosyltransferase family protein n=1 Tax=Striga asiatica TaxID=4170 RepID=A0A5A7QAW9_STRAF|nr:O-fucosyltransferase family protein [Striga asiatica]